MTVIELLWCQCESSYRLNKLLRSKLFYVPNKLDNKPARKVKFAIFVSNITLFLICSRPNPKSWLIISKIDLILTNTQSRQGKALTWYCSETNQTKIEARKNFPKIIPKHGINVRFQVRGGTFDRKEEFIRLDSPFWSIVGPLSRDPTLQHKLKLHRLSQSEGR